MPWECFPLSCKIQFMLLGLHSEVRAMNIIKLLVPAFGCRVLHSFFCCIVPQSARPGDQNRVKGELMEVATGGEWLVSLLQASSASPRTSMSWHVHLRPAILTININGGHIEVSSTLATHPSTKAFRKQSFFSEFEIDHQINICNSFKYFLQKHTVQLFWELTFSTSG